MLEQTRVSELTNEVIPKHNMQPPIIESHICLSSKINAIWHNIPKIINIIDHINDFLPEAIDIRGEKGDCFYKNLAASIIVPEYDIAASSYSAFDNEPTVDIKVDDDNKTIQFIFGIPRVIPSYGHIDDRPKESETCHIPIGFCYFATNLQKPLWWNGTSWVDAMGTVVAMA